MLWAPSHTNSKQATLKGNAFTHLFPVWKAFKYRSIRSNSGDHLFALFFSHSNYVERKFCLISGKPSKIVLHDLIPVIMCLLSWGASHTKRLGAGSEAEMLTFPVNSLFQTDYFQLRLPSLPFREPDPSQKCLHVLSIFSLKVLIFSSGCLPSLSGSRTRARNAYISN